MAGKPGDGLCHFLYGGSLFIMDLWMAAPNCTTRWPGRAFGPFTAPAVTDLSEQLASRGVHVLRHACAIAEPKRGTRTTGHSGTRSLAFHKLPSEALLVGILVRRERLAQRSAGGSIRG